ncbi:tRNA pseudouridine(55) synthase TruB [Candidatus Izemoplasma sp. B36]|uniref:tRNA pseudouridine(55) synthase TruB n=1 Tax=Candidatus Izemoplasma sp. B36 TaxID=3242468 RepID=UPI003557CE80
MMDGIVNVNKPTGFTSHDIVNIARKSLNTKRIGHIGTLDPNATGVLVLCVNKATKLVKYFENHTKTYIARIRLGVLTDTDDLTGEILESKDASHLTFDIVKKELNTFLGKQKQVPPKYSAIKIKGKKLYELARRDLKIPNIEPRDIEIYNISDYKLIEQNTQFIFEVKIKVSKGTYIRAIARDLGEKLGVHGTLEALQRTKINNFDIKDSISVENLRNGNFEVKEPFQYLDLPKIEISSAYKRYIENGRLLDPNLFPDKTDTIIYSEDKEVLAIYYYDSVKKFMRMSVKWC